MWGVGSTLNRAENNKHATRALSWRFTLILPWCRDDCRRKFCCRLPGNYVEIFCQYSSRIYFCELLKFLTRTYKSLKKICNIFTRVQKTGDSGVGLCGFLCVPRFREPSYRHYRPSEPTYSPSTRALPLSSSPAELAPLRTSPKSRGTPS